MRTLKRRLSSLCESNGKIFSLPVFGRDTSGVLNIILEWLENGEEKETKMVVTVNPEHIMKALKDGTYMKILKEANINVIDGVGLVWAKRVRGGNFWQRLWSGFWVGVGVLRGRYREDLVPGVELMDGMCGLGYRVGFLGGWGDRAKRTKKYFEKRYKGFSGVAMGSECDGQTVKIMGILKKNKVRILLVAYGMERQERWIKANLASLGEAGVRVAMGVGRSFDYYSGDLPRAPEWVRRMGLEWLFSLAKEPKRWRRQLVLPEFVWRVLTK